MKRYLIPVLLLVLVSSRHLLAEWACNASQSVPVAVAKGNQWNVQVASDGNMGSFVVWQDRRDGATDKLYLQHVDATGTMVWVSGGVPVCNASGFQYYPQLASDGGGGVVVVWQDNRIDGRDYHIYAQRISGNGIVHWIPPGIAVCEANGNQYSPRVVSDGEGGVVITWQDNRSGEFDIYAQRIDSSGQSLWPAGGVAVCSAAGNQVTPQLASDGRGGAVIAWSDFRSGGFADIYCQRVSGPRGRGAWSSDGIPVCTASNTQWNPQIVTDGNQGAIICWQDRRSSSVDQVYAQRVDLSGVTQWNANGGQGIQLAPSSGIQYYPRLASDGTGGAVAAWQDNRTGTDYDIYAQRVNTAGQILWASAGQAVCAAAGQQYNPQIIVDKGSSLIAWQDFRSSTIFDVYAQRLDLFGVAQWDANGTAVSLSSANKVNPQLTGDGLQGAIFAWADFSDGSGTADVYAQRIAGNGKLAGGCYRSFTQDSLSLKAIRIFVNRTTPIKMPNAGNVRDSVFGRGAFHGGVVIGIPRLDSIRYYGWIKFNASANVRTALPDSGIAHPFDRIFNRKFWGNMPNLSARVYNNCLLGEMLALKVNIAASDAGITNSRFGDLVFNDASDPTNVLNHRSLRRVATYVDSLLTLWKWYHGINYKQIAWSLRRVNTAFDGDIDTVSTRPFLIKSNRALFAVPFLLPSTDPLPPVPAFIPESIEDQTPREYVLRQNYPNPFNPVTTIEFDLPRAALVTLKVYNILGQEIATLLDHAALDVGTQQAFFDASPLSSGVYFYRLVATNTDGSDGYVSSAKKMLFVK